MNLTVKVAVIQLLLVKLLALLHLTFYRWIISLYFVYINMCSSVWLVSDACKLKMRRGVVQVGPYDHLL